jgi:hypothetical protein
MRYAVDADFFLEQTPQALMAAPPDLEVLEELPAAQLLLEPDDLARRLDPALAASVEAAGAADQPVLTSVGDEPDVNAPRTSAARPPSTAMRLLAAVVGRLRRSATNRT